MRTRPFSCWTPRMGMSKTVYHLAKDHRRPSARASARAKKNDPESEVDKEKGDRKDKEPKNKGGRRKNKEPKDKPHRRRDKDSGDKVRKIKGANKDGKGKNKPRPEPENEAAEAACQDTIGVCSECTDENSVTHSERYGTSEYRTRKCTCMSCCEGKELVCGHLTGGKDSFGLSTEPSFEDCKLLCEENSYTFSYKYYSWVEKMMGEEMKKYEGPTTCGSMQLKLKTSDPYAEASCAIAACECVEKGAR